MGFPLSATFDRRLDGVDVVVGGLAGLAVVARDWVPGVLLVLYSNLPWFQSFWFALI